MKRTFAVLGGVALAASFLNLYLNFFFAVVFSLIAIGVLTFRNKKNAQLLICMICVSVLALNITNLASKQDQAKDIKGERVMKAQILEVEEYGAYNRITVNTRVDSLRLKAELFDFSKGNYTQGDILTLTADLEEPSHSYGKYLSANGIQLYGTVSEISEINRGKGIYKGIYHLRNYIEDTLKNTLGIKGSAPLIAIITGNQSYFEAETERAIRASGTSHIMVVSGLHLGILCGAAVGLLKRFKARPKFVFLGGIATVFLILAICSFHISAIRAALTYVVMLLGVLLQKRADALNSLGFAVFIIVVANPFVAGNVSFLLSVSATFGVVVLAPMLKRICTPFALKGKVSVLYDQFLQALCVSVAALLCALPILIFYFGSISVASIFVNILISYAVSLALTLTALGVLTSFIPFVGKMILLLAASLGGYVMWVINLFGRAERFIIYFDETSKIIASLTGIVIILSIIYFDIKKERKETHNAD